MYAVMVRYCDAPIDSWKTVEAFQEVSLYDDWKTSPPADLLDNTYVKVVVTPEPIHRRLNQNTTLSVVDAFPPCVGAFGICRGGKIFELGVIQYDPVYDPLRCDIETLWLKYDAPVLMIGFAEACGIESSKIIKACLRCAKVVTDHFHDYGLISMVQALEEAFDDHVHNPARIAELENQCTGTSSAYAVMRTIFRTMDIEWCLEDVMMASIEALKECMTPNEAIAKISEAIRTEITLLDIVNECIIGQEIQGLPAGIVTDSEASYYRG